MPRDEDVPPAEKVAVPPVVDGTIRATSIQGTALAVEADVIFEGRICGTTIANRVEKHGTAVGVKVDKIGR